MYANRVNSPNRTILPDRRESVAVHHPTVKSYEEFSACFPKERLCKFITFSAIHSVPECRGKLFLEKSENRSVERPKACSSIWTVFERPWYSIVCHCAPLPSAVSSDRSLVVGAPTCRVVWKHNVTIRSRGTRKHVYAVTTHASARIILIRVGPLVNDTKLVCRLTRQNRRYLCAMINCHHCPAPDSVSVVLYAVGASSRILRRLQRVYTPTSVILRRSWWTIVARAHTAIYYRVCLMTTV